MGPHSSSFRLTAVSAALAAATLAGCGERADPVAERQAANRAQAAQVRTTADENRSAAAVDTYDGSSRGTASMGAAGGQRGS